MRAPGFFPITVRRGDHRTATVSWFDENYTPVNLSGYSAVLEVRKHAGNSSVGLLRTTPAVNSTSLDLTVTKNQTNAMPAGEWVYELVLWSDNERFALLRGPFIVLEPIADPDYVPSPNV